MIDAVYTVPKCDCGEELIYSDTETLNRFYKIKRSGIPWRNPVRMEQTDVGNPSLFCFSCRKQYEIASDCGEPMIRGARILKE